MRNVFLISILLISIVGCTDSKVKNDKNVTTTKEVKVTAKESNNSSTKVAKEPTFEFNLTTTTKEVIHIKTEINGLNFLDEKYKDKVVFLTFFGYNCPPCLREIPGLVELSKKYKDLRVIGIEVRGLDKKDLTNFIKDKNINYPVIQYSKESDKFMRYIAFKANWQGTIPFMLIFNKKGGLEYMQVGLIPEKVLDKVYNQLNSK